MTIVEAMQRGIIAVRKEYWAFEDDRLELCRLEDVEGKPCYGPWGKLVSPQSAVALGAVYGEQSILVVGDSAEDWIEYEASHA